MRIEAVTVSVNYDDYLDITLPYLKSQVDSVIVATSPKDKRTQAVCDKHNVRYVATNRVNQTPSGEKTSVNQGGGIADALAVCDRKDWLLVCDADIVLPQNTRKKLEFLKLKENCLYGAMRYHCHTHKRWLSLASLIKQGSIKLPAKYMCNFAGFFQLFHSSYHSLRKNLYPDGPNALGVDMEFTWHWPQAQRICTGIVTTHLGHPVINRRGRKSKRFTPPEPLPTTVKMIKML